MPYAEVCVNSPAGREQLFSYAIPPGLDIVPGHAVWVPFGNRILQGIVVSLSQYPAVEPVRDIEGLIEPEPVLGPNQIELALWLSHYYLSSLFDAIALFLPPGFERRALTLLSASDTARQVSESLNPEQISALSLIQKGGRLALRDLEKELGKKKAQTLVSQLVNRGLVARSYELEPVKVKPKTEAVVGLGVPQDEVPAAISDLRRRRAGKQASLLEFLAHEPRAVPLAGVVQAGYSRALVRTLVKKDLAALQSVEVSREPINYANIGPSLPLKPTAAQTHALLAINQSLAKGKPQVFLLHGVTGSGKTEVYLQSLARAKELGKRAIVLVPEIALTPQTIECFAARFPGRVAVLHSGLSLGEQFDQWRAIKRGDYDVVIGARSAIFAPQPDLGLIVIDEEHEWSYKQQDRAPRYHARRVALRLAELAGASVILGSATPDVESYYHARRSDYTLLELPERVTPRDGAPMPQVEVIDLRAELKSGNRSIFSRALEAAISRALARSEQVILFFNRRGAATFIQCRNCGLVVRCQRCQTAMSYHSAEEKLVCHHCGYRQLVPRLCPRCSSRRIKFLGLGTQKLEQETASAFPGARLLRWDSDSARGRHSHEQIMASLRSHQADILIGTQMVAKGLDLPQVTLVGVVSADTALNLPDFRACERTYQLLSQVSGRAGRGEQPGLVIIQSYSPEHYSIRAVPGNDYRSFYEQELAFRRELGNPPFSQLVRLTYSHTSEAAAQREAERLKRQLLAELAARGVVDIRVVGPAPAFISRLRGRYRWQVMLKGNEPACLLRETSLPAGWAVDVDPLGLG